MRMPQNCCTSRVWKRKLGALLNSSCQYKKQCKSLSKFETTIQAVVNHAPVRRLFPGMLLRLSPAPNLAFL